MQTDDNGVSSTEKNFKSNKHLRLVRDITFSSQELTVKTFNVDYSGVFDGNGMTISDIRINADTTKSSNAINKQLTSNYEEEDTYDDDNNELTPNRKATSVGMFAKLSRGAVVKNLDITIAELYGTGVNFVGTIFAFLTRLFERILEFWQKIW